MHPTRFDGEAEESTSASAAPSLMVSAAQFGGFEALSAGASSTAPLLFSMGDIHGSDPLTSQQMPEGYPMMGTSSMSNLVGMNILPMLTPQGNSSASAAALDFVRSAPSMEQQHQNSLPDLQFHTNSQGFQAPATFSLSSGVPTTIGLSCYASTPAPSQIQQHSHFQQQLAFPSQMMQMGAPTMGVPGLSLASPSGLPPTVLPQANLPTFSPPIMVTSQPMMLAEAAEQQRQYQQHQQQQEVAFQATRGQPIQGLCQAQGLSPTSQQENVFASEEVPPRRPIQPAPPPLSARASVPGLYSATGFDMIGILAKVASRKNPQVAIGPVDMSCSFVVSDARATDFPIVYVSETFERLTGYSASDCVGRNCRFLQSPDGLVGEGSYRRYVDNATVYVLKQSLLTKAECQVTLINYRKGGEPFINLITMVPIWWGESSDTEPDYFVGFQVDLVEQPSAIMTRMKNGTYVVNYRVTSAPARGPRAIMDETEMGLLNSGSTAAHPQASAQAPVAVGDVNATTREAGIAAVPGHGPGPSHTAAIDAASSGSRTLAEEALESNLAKVWANEDEPPHQQPMLAPAEGEEPGAGHLDVAHLLKTSTGSFAVEVTSLVDAGNVGEATRLFCGLLAEQADFVHVLSLRGVMLYVSPDCQRILEYEQNELLGHNLSEFCHPGDLVSVMREIKESSNCSHPINLVFRIRRKRSGYTWMEVSGRCTQGEKAKGKKFVVLTGRERPVMRVNSEDVRQIGGMQPQDMWSKVALDGLFLHVASATVSPPSTSSTPEVTPGATATESYDLQLQALVDASAKHSSNSPSHLLIGFKPNELVGKNLFDLVHIEDLARVRRALSMVREGLVCVLVHRMKNRKGEYRAVTSALLPGDDANSPKFALHRCSERQDADVESAPSQMRSFQANPVLNEAEDVFDVLSPVRCTSWQYELHQLRLQNRKLRAEVEQLEKASQPARSWSMAPR